MTVSSMMRKGKTLLTASECSKSFWLAAQKLPIEAQSRYHLYGVYQHSQDLDLNRLIQALQVTVNTHYNLRSNFFYEGEQLKHVIQDTRDANLIIYHANTAQASQAIIDRAIHQPFHLEMDSLYRFVLVKNAHNQTYTLVLNFHHIIVDEMQLAYLIRQIEDNYHQPKSLALTDKSVIKKLEEYLIWEKEQIQKTSAALSVSQFKEYSNRIELPYKTRSIEQIEKEVRVKNYVLSDDLYQKLKMFSAETDFSIFNLLKTAWATLMAKYSNQARVTINSPCDMRKEQFEEIKGCYLQACSHPVDLELSLQEIIEAERKNRALPIHAILSRIRHASSGEVSIVQAPANFVSLKLAQENKGEGHKQLGNAALLLRYDEWDDGLHYQILSIEHLFEAWWLENIPAHFETLLTNLIEQRNEKLKRINILTPQEYQKLVYDYNRTDREYPKDKTIHALFEEQVERTPNNIAVVFEEKELTYRELNERSNQLARYIRERYKEITEEELKGDMLIALCLERSEEMIIAILAVLKAGGAYVPIDPGYPEDRIRYMLEDTQAKLVLTQESLKGRLEAVKHNQLQSVFIGNEEVREGVGKLARSNLEPVSHATDLAYVIYTSGTTGSPKGVMIEHRSVINYVSDTRSRILKNSFKIGFATNITFDLSVTTTLGVLLNGKSIVIYGGDTKDINAYIDHLNTNQVDTLKLVPSYAEQLFSMERKLDSVKVLVVGGEKLSILQRNLFEHAGINYLFDEYWQTDVEYEIVYFRFQFSSCSRRSNWGIVYWRNWFSERVLEPTGINSRAIYFKSLCDRRR